MEAFKDTLPILCNDFKCEVAYFGDMEVFCGQEMRVVRLFDKSLIKNKAYSSQVAIAQQFSHVL